MAEKFREVGPLIMDKRKYADTVYSNATHIYLAGKFLDVARARRLRDWLNKALPEEKP